MVCTKHVNDLRGASSEETFGQICAQLSEQFGELTFPKKCFEHLGIMHKQLDDFTVESTQDHYVKQLRLMSLDSLPDDDEEKSMMLIFVPRAAH